MKFRLKKLDVILIVAMIIIAGIVVYEVGILPQEEKSRIPVIEFTQDVEKRTLTVNSFSETILWSDIQINGSCDTSSLGKYVTKEDKIQDSSGIIVITHIPTGAELGNFIFPIASELPSSFLLANEKDVSPQDEGVHFKSILNTREWWFYTVVFSKDCDLPGWVATIGFCHLSWGDLRLTLKPDLIIVTLQSPSGEVYGGMLNKKRGGLLGLMGLLTLDAKTPGVDLKYGNSWAKGEAPRWHVHAEDEDIDSDNEIILDLDYFAPSNPLWIHSSRLVDKGKGKIANYIFTGCKVEGTVKINSEEFNVKGIGHHEHSWSPGFLHFAIKGWDISYIVLDNGWSIYYSNYYLTRQILPIDTPRINPQAIVVITNNKGTKMTKLENVDVTVGKYDRVFMLLKIPMNFSINAKPKILSQPLLSSYNIKLNLDLNAKNTYEKIWKFPTYVGMKIGLNSGTGKITWSEEGEQEEDLAGIGAAWFMRSF